MGLMNTLEPEPIENDNPPCWDEVVEYYSKTFPSHQYKDDIINLMYERDAFGREKYGRPLRAFDGRNSFKEILQEELDGLVYDQKAIDEGKDKYGILKILMQSKLVGIENVYILYREQFFCEHGFDTSIENCPINEECCR
jgi:hypothetical protein